MERGGAGACESGERERERHRGGVMQKVRRQFHSISPGRRAEEPGDGALSQGAAASAAPLCTGAAKLASKQPAAR